MSLPLTDPGKFSNERRGLEGYARHAGRADILREDIDGEIGD